jgi:hypothetical protein
MDPAHDDPMVFPEARLVEPVTDGMLSLVSREDGRRYDFDLRDMTITVDGVMLPSPLTAARAQPGPERSADQVLDQLQSGLDDALLDGLVGLGIEEGEVDRDMAVGVASDRYHDERYEQLRLEDLPDDPAPVQTEIMDRLREAFSRRIDEEIRRGQEGREAAGITSDQVVALARAFASGVPERFTLASIQEQLERRFAGRPISEVTREEIAQALSQFAPVTVDPSRTVVTLDRERGMLHIEFTLPGRVRSLRQDMAIAFGTES